MLAAYIALAKKVITFSIGKLISNLFQIQFHFPEWKEKEREEKDGIVHCRN